MSNLALLGGPPALAHRLRPYSSVSVREREAVASVIDSGCLSGYYGTWGKEFFGGPQVRALESNWAESFDVPYAVAVNSATSGLFAALGAAGISPGDEVIVPPLTMSATVMAPLIYGGIPVFADVEPDTFCLDLAAVEAAITPKTRAIIAVNLFGHPARLRELREIADRSEAILIEDNAQSALASEQGHRAGTIGHLGIFSLNYHKHIHTGEGGMVVTHDSDLALRLQAIRNHGENVVLEAGIKDLTNMVGFNFRMTELSAAVGLVQLDEAERHVSARIEIAEYLTQATRGLEGLFPPQVRTDCRHVYYTWTLRVDAKALGLPRRVFSRALAAEGFPHVQGYVAPLYLLPLFQHRRAIGSDGFPFTLTERAYEPGLCPVAERLHFDELLFFETCAYDVGKPELEAFANALRKVHDGRRELLDLTS